MRPLPTLAVAAALAVVAACSAPVGGVDGGSGDSPPAAASAIPASATGTPPGLVRAAGTPEAVRKADRHAAPRPSWLGTRVLAVTGAAQPTPSELTDRRLATPWSPHLPPPADETYAWTAGSVPREVAERSTWRPGCPVGLESLRYMTVTFWGFDQRHHTGELLVHHDVVDDLAEVFARLHEARFPIEEMRVITADELDAAPTGDGNVTTVFVCRSTVSGSSWSEHAYGRAIDVNPFHNPYVRGSTVIPELATAYADRSLQRPGMIMRGDVVTRAFADVGWVWGGDWTSASDPMHFSRSGR